MSLNFDYTSVPTKSKSSLGYVYGGNLTDLTVTNLPAYQDLITMYTFPDVTIGTYMFVLNGWLKVNDVGRYLTKISLNTPITSIYSTASDTVVINTIVDGYYLPMNAGTTFTNNTRTQSYNVKISANYATNGCVYTGSIQLVRIA